MTQLKYEVTNQRYKEGLTNDAMAAMVALDIAATDFEFRDTPSRDAVAPLREKLDALDAMPGGRRFLKDREFVCGNSHARSESGHRRGAFDQAVEARRQRCGGHGTQ